MTNRPYFSLPPSSPPPSNQVVVDALLARWNAPERLERIGNEEVRDRAAGPGPIASSAPTPLLILFL